MDRCATQVCERKRDSLPQKQQKRNLEPGRQARWLPGSRGQFSHGELFHSLLNPSISSRNKDVQGRSCDDAGADARLKQGFGNGSVTLMSVPLVMADGSPCDLGAILLESVGFWYPDSLRDRWLESVLRAICRKLREVCVLLCQRGIECVMSAVSDWPV